MNFWTFLDRNGFGVALVAIALGFFAMLAVSAPHMAKQGPAEGGIHFGAELSVSPKDGGAS